MEPNNFNYRTVGASESVSMHQVYDELVLGRDPFSEMQRLMGCFRAGEGTAFERYAGSLFAAAGSDAIAERTSELKLKRLAPGDGRLARIVTPSPIGKTERRSIEATEAALNRIISIVDAVDDGIPPTIGAPERQPVNISFMGVSHPQPRAGYRSAQVALPTLEHGDIQPEYYNEVDWRVLDSLACIARTLFQQSLTPNTRLSIFGAQAPAKSDWDVRTRLATVLDGLELPFRCRFRFDCNMVTETISVRFDYPPASMIPKMTLDSQPDRCVSSADADALLHSKDVPTTTKRCSRPGMKSGPKPDQSPEPDGCAFSAPGGTREVFAMRFACLVAAACFGSGRNVRNVHLAAMDERWSRPLLSCVFERRKFVKTVLSAIDSGSFVDARLRRNPEEFASLIKAEHLDWASPDPGSTRYGHIVVPPDDTMGQLRTPPWEDERRLPDDAARFFRTMRIQDVDASHYYGAHAEIIDEAKRDSDDSIMAAILRLESIVDELEHELEAPDSHADARPLYCPHALARLAVVLLDDEMAVSSQAEAFLDSGMLEEVDDADLPWYFRAPSALFHAHMGLSDLYQRMGDFAGSEQHANRCLALAPTAVDGYYRKADILAERQLFSQAANVLIAGLNVATTQSDSALLYYFLGLVMWNMGMKRHAAAIHVYCASLQGEFAEKSARIVEGMKRRGDAPVISHASPVAASQELIRLRIPIAPVDLRAHVASATLALSCANAPRAAAPFAAALARCCRNDAAIVAACQSLQSGTELGGRP